MISSIIESCTTWLHDYVNTFQHDGNEHFLMIRHKLNHSKRVAQYCRELAKDLQWTDEDVATGELLGLLHDVGRFPQLTEFGTFVDACSVNHGERGYEVARELQILSTLSSRHRLGVLDGIRYHNCREIPQGLDRDSLPFVKLVRDADKLDIFNTLSTSMLEKDFMDQLEKTLKIRQDGPVDPGALNDVLEQKTVSDSHTRSVNDFRLMQLSWVYDINFKPTFMRLHTSGIIGKISMLIPDTDRVREAKESIESYLKDRVSC
ncbi:HD domain-containing protein [bacterium]|nr:HD domain-containing protein [bacterium]